MTPKIHLTRSPTAKTLELRLPAIVYDDLMAHRVSTIVSLTAKEYFTLGELSEELGVTPEEALYCGYRILEASRGDADVAEDCLGMVAARGRE